MADGGLIIGSIIAAGASMASASMQADEAEAARKQQQEYLDQQRKNAAWVRDKSKPDLSGATLSNTGTLSGIDENLKSSIEDRMNKKVKELEGVQPSSMPIFGHGYGSNGAPVSDSTSTSYSTTVSAMPYGLNSTQNNPSIPSANGSPSNAPVGLLASAMPQQQPAAAPAAMMPSSLDAAVSSGSVPYASVHPESVSMNSPLFTPEQAKALSSAILSIGKGAQASAAAQSKAEQQRIAMIQRQMAEEEIANRRRVLSSVVQPARIIGANIG